MQEPSKSKCIHIRGGGCSNVKEDWQKRSRMRGDKEHQQG